MAKKQRASAARRWKTLAARHGTPLLAVSRAALQAQLRRFRRALPRVKPFYAVKANSHPEIVAFMAKAGAGFDVASRTEMALALEAGATPDRLVFANTIKPVEALRAATEAGVDLLTFDSEYELDKIAEHAPGARVLVRIKVPNVGSSVELSLKFGVLPADALDMLIKAHGLGLVPVGVSFHVGSQCTRVANFVDSLEMAAIILRDAHLKRLPLAILDIGGGFPIARTEDEEDPFDEIARVVAAEIDRLFDPNVRILAEPGRFLVGPAATLVTRVVGKAIRENKHWYYLDDGVYGSLSGLVFDHAKYTFRARKKGPTRLSTLAGPTCDSFDIIARGEALPELDVGDLVTVPNIGAYSVASASSFNGFPPAKVVMVP